MPAHHAAALTRSDTAAPARFGPTLAVLATAQLMVVLDASIVNVALPDIGHTLTFSESGLEWVVNAYALTYGGLMLFGGRLGDLYERRRMLGTGITLFALASLGGGLAPDSSWLLASRAVQGAGAAMVSPTALALVATSFPERSLRNRALGVYSAVCGSGAAIGLIMGGVLTQWGGWRWVFFVNIPIAAMVLLLLRQVPRGEGRRGPLDWPGALASTSAISVLVFGLFHVSSVGWHDRTVIMMFALSGVLAMGFVVIELRCTAPLMSMRLLTSRIRSGAFMIMLFTGGAMFPMFCFLSQFLQDILDFDPLHAGLSFLPLCLAIVVMSQVVSKVLARTGPRLPLIAGQALLGLGLAGSSRLGVDSGYVHDVLPVLLVMGLGLGCVFVSLTTSSVEGVSENETGLVAGLLATCQQVGGCLGLAVLTTVAVDAFETRLPAGRPAAAQVLEATAYGWTKALGCAVVMAVAGVVTSLIVIPRHRDGQLSRHVARPSAEVS
jgi:EmrB/QacA subfamily drug resistance transporter